jgi:gamma-glutamyl-gamma-aminobutyrate hydrolase PuuD
VRKLGLTQRVEVFGAVGERRDCLDQAWSELLLPLGYLPVPLPNAAGDVQAVAGRVSELGLDGVILTGGNDLAAAPGARTAAPERDRFESLLLDVCAERALPVLGVCRGLQMLVRHGGGTLVPCDGHAGTRHELRVAKTSPMPLADRAGVNSYHDFTVGELGPDFVAVARAADGSVEAVVHRHLPIWGIMWHPEREPRDEGDAPLLKALFGAPSP